MSREELRSAAAAEVDRWEKQLNDELLRLFDRMESVTLVRLQGTKARKHTRHWEPPGTRPLEVKQVIDPARWLMDAMGSVAPILRRLYTAVYGRVAGQLAGGAEVPSVDDDKRVEEAVQARLDLVAKGVETAVTEVQEFIDRGEEAGSSMSEMAASLRELYKARKPVWSQRIATISAVGSINQAAMFAAADQGSSAKQWLSRRDAKVRDTHVHADGQVRLIDEHFRLGGIPTHPQKSRLLFPGDPDPAVPLDEVMNCRCTLLFSPPKPRGVPLLPKKSAPELETKVDYVRTPAGARHYGQPIGSPIVPNAPLAPAFSAAAPAAAPSRSSSRPSRPTRIGKIGGQPVELAGDDPSVRKLVAKYAQQGSGNVPDPATTEVAALRDSKGRVAAYVVWQTEDGPQPKGTILEVSVHPSLRGRRIGDQMVALVVGHDSSVQPTSRPAANSTPTAPAARTVTNAPTTTRSRPAGGSPAVADRSRPGDAPGTSGDFDADAARIDRLQKAYMRDRVDTTSLFSRGGRWTRDREKQQQAIIDHFLSQPGVKKDRKILILGGLPGAGKTTTINSPAAQQALGIDLDDYVTVNADEVKAEMIARGMVPDYPGLSADEAATLFHAESFEIAHSLMRQAAKQGKNFAYDTSLKTSGQVAFATGAGSRSAPPPWETTMVFVDVPVAVAKQRAKSRYLAGDRYMPLGLIDGMRSSSRRYNSGPAQQFESVKGQASRWVVFDNAGADPVITGQGGRGPRRSRSSAPAPAPASRVAPRPAAAKPAAVPVAASLSRVSEGRMTTPRSESELSVGQRVWVRSSGDAAGEWDVELGTITSTDVYAGDPDVDPADPKQVGVRLDGGASVETEYWHLATAIDGDPPAVKPRAAAAAAPPAPRVTAPVSAPAPAAAAPAAGLPAHLPPVPDGAVVYAHPQGKYIYLLPDGSMQVWKPDGKRGSSSATPQKLQAGYGGWAEVVGGQAPAFGPTPSTRKPDPVSTGTSPKLVPAPAKAPEEQASTPAPAGSMPVAPMDFNEAALADVPKYIADPDYVFQQKVDGIRGVLVIEPGKAPWFASKKGDKLQSSTAAKITGPMLAKLPSTPAGSPSYRVEGELLNGKFHVFDMVVVGQESTDYETRKKMADAWVEAVAPQLPQVEALPTARTAAEKQALWDAVVNSGAEGVMMKRRDAGYHGGRRVNHTLKAKITATADVVVIERNIGGKDNARIGLLVNGKVTPIGTISTLGKGDIKVGEVVEVEYLWATDSNTLAQPRIVRKRPDKTVADVTDASQLRVVDKTVLALAQKRLEWELEYFMGGADASGS